MKYLAIILLCIAAACVYGIIHDQITARICVEYFTIGHLDIFGTDNPTLLGIGWGIVATWWVGLFLGIPLAIVSLAGPAPQRTASTLLRPIAKMLLIVGLCALVMGLIGHTMAQLGWVFLTEPLVSQVPANRHIPFLTDLWIHLGSYFFGLAGGIWLCVHIRRSRRKALTTNGSS